MVETPINDTFWNRALTLCAVKIVGNRYTGRFWKHPGGVLFASKFCIKVMPFMSLTEAHTMQFVARHTSIPVPRVFCAFTHKGRSYTVMERIDGEIVALGWANRSEESKRKVLAQLKSLIQQLRDVQPPEAMKVVNVAGEPIYDGRLPGNSFWGPFATQEDFHLALREGIALVDDTSLLPTDMTELFEFHRRQFPPPVLTHGDLSSLNIMVRDDEIVSIIDWETAGWFPYYWEYVCAWHVNPHNEFWRDEVDKFLDPLPHELKIDGIRRRYFGDV
ncbi:kinase-like protein [Xylariaceae sp. FL0016]|nr:kinase-like protein [Xylariaceae sp. FL0016]